MAKKVRKSSRKRRSQSESSVTLSPEMIRAAEKDYYKNKELVESGETYRSQAVSTWRLNKRTE